MKKDSCKNNDLQIWQKTDFTAGQLRIVDSSYHCKTASSVYPSIHRGWRIVYPQIPPLSRKLNSTETGLLTVQNSVNIAMDKRKVTPLIPSCLSVASDTANHSLHIHLFDICVGITGDALNWFRSCLQDQRQLVCWPIKSHLSKSAYLDSRGPRGPVLGPSLYALHCSSWPPSVQCSQSWCNLRQCGLRK